MIRRSAVIAVEIVLGLIAALAIGLGIAWWRLSQGPIELSFFRDQMAVELGAARGGRPVEIERVELALARSGGALELRAVGVKVLNGEGGVLSRADRARIELRLLPLLIGRVSLVGAEFEGGEVAIAHKPDGAWHIVFGPAGTPPDIVVPPPPPDETWNQRVNRVLDGLEAAFRPIGAGGALQSVSLTGARLSIIDDISGARWVATGADISLARRGAALALAADARLEGAQGLAPAHLRITTDTRFRVAEVEFGADEVRPRALLSPAALGAFAGLDAPLTATVSIGLDRERGVTRFEGNAAIGRGAADMAGGRFDLSGGQLHGRYDIAKDELIFDRLRLNGARTRIDGVVRVRDLRAVLNARPGEPASFNIALPSLTLDVPGTFAQPISLSDVEATGAILSAERAIVLTRVSARASAARVEGAGRFYWAEAGSDRRTHMGVQFRGQIEGALEVRQVVQMWPIGLGEGAREYLDRSLVGGRVVNGRFNLDIRPSDQAAGVLRDEAVDVRFGVEAAEMRFVDTMSPIAAGRGAAVLRGNRFEMSVPEARLNDLVLSNGRVEIPRFKPAGAMTTISAHAEGDVRDLLEILAQAPLSLGERLPVDPASATGRANVDLRLQRPNLREVPPERWRFSVRGGVRDFAGAMTMRRVALSQGQLRIEGDHNAIVVSGPVIAGRSEIAEVRWTERLRVRGQPSSEYRITGVFDANDLTRLGYPIAGYAQGRIGVQVSGRGRGFDVDQAQVDLDLTDAAIEAPRSFWTKRANQPASARFNVARRSDGGFVFDGIDARGGGMFAQGRVALARDGSVIEAEIPRLTVQGRSDARLSMSRASDGALVATIDGALFDAAPFMGASEAPEEGARNTSAPVPAPLRARVNVDRLKLRGGATLSNARVSMETTRGVLSFLTADGESPTGAPFTLSLGPRPGEPDGRIVFRSGDAGFAVRALTGSENLVGGDASASGEWRAGQGRFAVTMHNFQLVRLPAMARLLSSAGSLTGLVEMLNGDGIGFSVMEAQMTYADNRLAFAEGSMRGPSLGLTASGAYDIGQDDLDIDGVVAPSPMLNLSMLGEIPVIGNILVSRRGEGVVGMTYSINGRVGEPRVGVNPLSALTPGILRRIFEPLPPRAAPPVIAQPSAAPG
ncbi:MAG: DUF3971 domain-containing protein [Terricaulis sp.]